MADALRVNAELTSCKVLKNEMDVAAAESLVAAVKGRDVSLAGITPEQTTADFFNRGLKPSEAVLLASDLSKPRVSASLTKLDVRYNRFCKKGTALLQQAVQGRSGFDLMM